MIRVGLLLLGAWVGFTGMLAHRHAVSAAGIVWPWGLVLTLVATGVLAHWAGTRFRLGGAWFALGWAGVLMVERLVGHGSYLVATDWLGWSFLLGGLVVIGVDVVRASRLSP